MSDQSSEPIITKHNKGFWETNSLTRSETDMIFDLLGPDNNVILADEVMVCDAHGTVVRVTDTYDRHFGVSAEYVLGKTVYELEKEGVFSPSITAIVLKTKKKITKRQFNYLGQPVLTTGVPIFNNEGEIKYVVCFNSLDSAQINNIKKKYNELQETLMLRDQEMMMLRSKNLVPKEMIIRSQATQDLWEMILNTADTKANVLITGETGVGKSMIARTIHSVSPRAENPFISINCSVINENLIESELFGYEKGAFTGADSRGKIGKIELAKGGTLFLDEIGDLPLQVQTKLLQLIQEKTMQRISGTDVISLDFKLIAATNRDLESDIKKGLFRRDLYYRLNVLRIHVPALRDRKEDICIMALEFLKRFNREYGKSVLFSLQLLDFFERHPWPGNVRQLENLVERLVITDLNGIVEVEHLPYEMRAEQAMISGEPAAPAYDPSKNLDEQLGEYERNIIISAYKKHPSTVALAKALKISQSSASRKIAKYINKQG
jgi:transcriptional regulator with PAS, ATPase and Fis domain